MHSMRKYLLLFFFLMPAIGFAIVKPKSIIIKFRSSASLQAPSAELHSSLTAISPLSFEKVSAIIPQRATATLQASGSFGFDRTICLPLRSTISADSAIKMLARFTEIEYSEPNNIYHIDKTITLPNDSLYKEQWSHQMMDVLGAWQYTKGNSSVHVGVIDTGIDWNHEDLIGQLAVNPKEDINHNGLFDAWPSSEHHLDAHGNMVTGDLDNIDEDGNGYVDDVIGYDFVDQEVVNFGDASGRDPFPDDEQEQSHGTAVSSVIAARTDNKIGIAGIAPDCRLVGLRALDALGNGESDDIAAAIIYAADNGVQILNLSFGDTYSSRLLHDAVAYAASKNVLIISSSGNDGNDARHYPSDYDECVSVGMTALDENDHEIVDSRSSHGEGLDIIAPGVDIPVLAAGNRYQTLSGTSFSAPATAAVAALLLSRNPKLSAVDIRSILVSTTDYISKFGYDHFHANGRVNAHRALEFIGGATVKIQSPTTDEVVSIGTDIPILGSVASPLFTKYSVSYAAGLNPDATVNTAVNWHEIAADTKQKFNDTLGNWNTTGLSGGTYTIRLAMQTSDSRSIEERLTVFLHESQAAITSFTLDTIFDKDKRALLIAVRSDSVTSASLLYKPTGTASWASKNDDNVTHTHSIILSSSEVKPGVPLDLLLKLETTSGSTVSLSTTSQLPDESVPTTGFLQKTYTLPSGYLLDTAVSTSSGDVVIESVAPGGIDLGLSTIGVFTFDKTTNKFSLTDSLTSAFIPHSIGSVTGAPSPQTLLQGTGNSIVVYKPNTSHSLLGDIVVIDTSFDPITSTFAVLLADLDGDGKDEIIGKTTTVNKDLQVVRDTFTVSKVTNGVITRFGELVNTTAPDPFHADNKYSAPEARSADFLGNNTKQVALLDDDADLIVFKYDPSSSSNFTPVFVDVNDGYSEGRNMTVGDYNGDGKLDIAFAYHGNTNYNADNEYDPSYWTVKVLLNDGNDTFHPAYIDHFNTARTLSPYRSSLGSLHGVTGSTGDALALCLFPNFYLLRWDPATSTMKPLWYYPVSNSPRGALAHDFDGNGLREFGFVTGDSIRFFERNPDLTSKTPTPAGFEVIPRDFNRIDLHFSAVEGVSRYYILRGFNEPGADLELIDSVSTTEYIDTDVSDGDVFKYSVEAYSNQFSIPLSDPAPPLSGLAHNTPVIQHIQPSGNTIILRSSQPLSTAIISGSSFMFDDSIAANSAVISGDSTIVLRTISFQPQTSHTLRIASFGLRDIWNAPFDTARFYSFSIPPVVTTNTFYIVRWVFHSSATIEVVFNDVPDDNALDPLNYTLTPYGKIISVSRETANDSALILTLDPKTILRPIGASFVLCIDRITSKGTPLSEPTGNCLGETPSAPSLEHTFVYPNPAKTSDEQLTFAGLTAQAEISIFTQSMRFIRRLSTTEKTGGVSWDMLDENGSKLPSGVYLYHITGKDANGNEVPSAEGKFVIIQK